MKIRMICRGLLMFVFFVFASTACANSLVTPADATAQSYWSNNGVDWRSPVNTINGSGMTLPVTRESTSSSEHQFGMWLSNISSGKATWIMFDMGEEMTLTGLRVWNYNEPFLNKKDYTARGIKSCELRYGGSAMLANGDTYENAGVWGTFAETLTFARATGKDGLEGEDIKFSTPITTRYVMLRILENYGDTDHTGLSEVRFYGRKIQRWYLEGDSSSTEFNTVRSDDLLQRVVASVDNNLTMNTSNVGLTVNDTYPENDISWLSDGSFGPAGAVGGLCIQGGTVTYNFDVSTEPDGYDISEVCVYTGWNSSGGRENPSYSLYCKRVGDSDFTPVGVGYYLCTITGSNNRHACLKMKNLDLKGVAALRFAFHGDSNGRGQQNFGVGYKEIDVFQNCGSAAVSPVAATAQSAWNARKPVNTINGGNLSPSKWPSGREVAIDTNAEKMWLSNDSKETWIAFDLGEECTVKGFHLWNYNEYTDQHGSKWQNRGIKTADIYIGTTMPTDGGSYASAGAAWGTFVQGMTFLRAPASSSYMGEDYAFNKPVRGRYFQFKVTSSYAGAAPSKYSDNYVGLGAIVFYCDVEEVVTRGSSGTKTISGSYGRVVTVKDGTGTVAPITLASETTRIHTLRGETYEGVSQIDSKDKTLELGKIELPYGTAGLEILPQGTLTCVGGVRNWMEWKLDADLFLHGTLSDNANGGVSLEKTGKGTVVFDGMDTRKGSTVYNGGTYRQTGGVSDTPGAAFNNSVCEFSAGTSCAASGMEFNSSEVSVSGTHIADWKNISVVSGASSLAVKDGGTLKFGHIMHSPFNLNLTLDGGTLGTSALGAESLWIPAVGGRITVGENGAMFDTSEGSGSIDVDILNEAAGKISKIGNNTLTIKRSVEGAALVSVEGGMLALSYSPIIHYDFNNVSGNTVPNLGTGGAALNGVISGSPEVVPGVKGNALSFCSSANGVATAGSVSMRQFTYAAWVKSAGRTGKDQRIIIGGSYMPNSEQFLGYLGTEKSNDNYWVFARDGHEYGVSTISVDTENWHHLAATYDGTKIIFYVDGVAVQTKQITQNMTICTMKIGIGNNVTPNDEYWNGAIDEAYVFDRVLSADEVAKLKADSWRTVNILDPESDLSISNGASLVLDGVDQTVSTFTLDGRLQCLGETTWGAIGSGAEYETPRITGNGILRVKGPRKFGTKIIVR